MKRWRRAVREFKRLAFEHCEMIRCRYCVAMLRYEDATVDHVRPRCRGGDERPENLAIACARCNHSKGSQKLPKFEATYPPAEWARRVH